MSRLRTRTASGRMTWGRQDSGVPEVETRVYTVDELPEEVANEAPVEMDLMWGHHPAYGAVSEWSVRDRCRSGHCHGRLYL